MLVDFPEYYVRAFHRYPLPVRRQGLRAMLKIATHAEEKTGAQLMIWWKGRGAARVLTHHGNALLLERAEGKASLSQSRALWTP